MLTSLETSNTPSWIFLNMVAAVLTNACKCGACHLERLNFLNALTTIQFTPKQASLCFKNFRISRFYVLTSSTFWAVLADASMNIKPCSFANCSPSSELTALLWARSLLLPISIIVMFAFACCLASSSQLTKWLKVSLLNEQHSHHNSLVNKQLGKGRLWWKTSHIENQIRHPFSTWLEGQLHDKRGVWRSELF